MRDVERAILHAFGAVHDPCSVAANTPLSVYDMGLVRHWTMDDDGRVRVVISPTFPSCVLIGSIMEQVEEAVRAVPGVADVAVELDSDVLWTRDEMTDEGRAWLAERRSTSQQRVPVRPQQWMDAGPAVRPRARRASRGEAG